AVRVVFQEEHCGEVLICGALFPGALWVWSETVSVTSYVGVAELVYCDRVSIIGFGSTPSFLVDNITRLVVLYQEDVRMSQSHRVAVGGSCHVHVSEIVGSDAVTVIS